jgi:hypothetical protein
MKQHVDNVEGATEKPAKLQLVMNRLWREQTSEDQTQALMTAAMQEMQDGYRVAFPIMVAAGGVCMGVALVAKRDWRTDLILGSEGASDATHVAILLLFSDDAEWEAEADKFVRLWPEQSNKPSRMVNAKGDSTVFVLADGEATEPLPR